MNERSLEPRMLPWQPKFYKDQTFFLYNFLFLEFQWIRFSNHRVIVNLITQWSTCKPEDVIIFTVVVVCSEPILSGMFRPFKRRYLWNQIRYQKTVNSVHSCFSCIFIWENKNFRFISTLNERDDYSVPFSEQQYMHGSCYISLFKYKSFDQSVWFPRIASNFRHSLSCGTIVPKIWVVSKALLYLEIRT